MIYQKFILRTIITSINICLLLFLGHSQERRITIDEAIEIARQNYDGLQRDRLAIEQFQLLAKVGLPPKPTQLSLSGEEFGANNRSGIHSINVQQSFYLPKVVSAHKSVYDRSADVAKKQLTLTDQELKRRIGEVYYQLQYATEEVKLVNEYVLLFEDFLGVTSKQLELGETGKIPVLAASARLKQALLDKEHASERYTIALKLFNLWLQSDITYNVYPDSSQSFFLHPDSIEIDNPHLELVKAEYNLSQSRIETEKAKLLPQIFSGLRLQTGSGDFPLFGYEIGMSMPLSKKSYQGNIDAAKVNARMQEAQFQVKQKELTRTVDELNYRIEHQVHILEYLESELTPLVKEQQEVYLLAYSEGEISYLELLDSLEQVVKVKRQYLSAIFEFNILQVELDYWLGR